MAYKIVLYGNEAEHIASQLTVDHDVVILDPSDPYLIIRQFDIAVRSADMIVLSADKDMQSHRLISSYLALWRSLSNTLQNRPIVLINTQQHFRNALDYYAGYRKSLPDEKNAEAKDWFVYPKQTPENFFVVLNSVEEAILFIHSRVANAEMLNIDLGQKQDQVPFLQEKYLGSKIFNNPLDYLLQRNHFKKMAFFPAAAAGNRLFEEQATVMGEVMAELGFDFINGGPDGGKFKDGPMRASAIGAQNKGAELLAIYSDDVLGKYVTVEQLQEFSHMNIIPLGLETERRAVMINLADIVIALFGAIGTIAEIEDAIHMGKPVILVNGMTENKENGYWGEYIEYLKSCGLLEKIYVLSTPLQISDADRPKIVAELKAAISTFMLRNLITLNDLDWQQVHKKQEVLSLEKEEEVKSKGYEASTSSFFISAIKEVGSKQDAAAIKSGIKPPGGL